MNRKRRQLGAVLLLVLASALGGTGCGSKEADKVATIQAAGVLHVAVVDTDSQYTRMNGGTPSGLEPELAAYIAEALGVEASFQVCSREKALENLASGEADVALGCINGSKSLEEEYQISTPYGKGYFYAVTKRGDYVLTIGALKGSALGAAENLDEETRSNLYMAEGISVIDQSSAKEAAESIKKGAIRAYICYEDQAKSLLEDPKLQVQNITNLEPEEFVIVAQKSDQTLVNGINTLIRQFLEAE